jgi:hypothetical protein
VFRTSPIEKQHCEGNRVNGVLPTVLTIAALSRRSHISDQRLHASAIHPGLLASIFAYVNHQPKGITLQAH